MDSERMLRVVLCFVWMYCGVVEGYRDGAPAEQCGEMMPRHISPAQLTDYPHLITPHTTTFKPGDTVQVTVGGTYRGLLLEARREGSAAPLGTWRDPPPDWKVLTCVGGGQAVTHSSSEDKTNATFTWVAPSTPNTNLQVQFVATIVVQKDTFYHQVKAEQLVQQEATGTDTQNTPFDVSGCGETKSCVYYGEAGNKECRPEYCEYMLSWTVTESSLDTAGAVRFEMWGQTEGWLGLGISDDLNMGDDEVYVCRVQAETNQPVVERYLNPGGRNASELQQPAHVTVMEAKYEDGQMVCTFARTLRIPEDETLRDLSTGTYHVVFTYGHNDDTTERIRRHSDEHPQITADKVAFDNLLRVNLAASRSGTSALAASIFFTILLLLVSLASNLR